MRAHQTVLKTIPPLYCCEESHCNRLVLLVSVNLGIGDFIGQPIKFVAVGIIHNDLVMHWALSDNRILRVTIILNNYYRHDRHNGQL